jgi:Uma2 family endonuclease
MSAHVQRLSPEEYLKLERAAEFRSEYFNGRMYAMAGASHRQAVVIANLVAALHHQLSKRGCLVTPSDLRVRVDPAGCTHIRMSLLYATSRNMPTMSATRS